MLPLPRAARWAQGAPPEAWAARLRLRPALQAARPPVAERYHYVPAAEIAPAVRLAVLVAEDAGFFEHGAVDFAALRDACQQWRAGRPLRGASTMSQQLAKNLFLSPERTLWRKIRELRLACWLERSLSKDRLFELYLNIIELGPGIYGVDAAARAYYGRPAAQLGDDEAAGLAASIPAPRLANPARPTAAWQRRRAAVQERMRQLFALRRAAGGR